MYPRNYVVQTNGRPFYRSQPYPTSSNVVPVATEDGDRFFFAPFLVGGLAGTALGYGIANNNQINNNGRPCCGFYPMPYPGPFPTTFPTYNTNTFYY